MRSLSTRRVQRSRDLENKYNQSSAALAVRWFVPREANLSSVKPAAAAGFAFQCVLTLGVVAWLEFRRRKIPEQDARLALAALFCTAAAFSPISWLEYYIALEVPYMALAYVAFSSGKANSGRGRAAKSVLAIAFIFNLSTRLFEPALDEGVAYLGSLLVLAAILVLSTMGGDYRGGESGSPKRARRYWVRA